MFSVLVTGANSFVGCHIIHALIKEQYNVIGCVRRPSTKLLLFDEHPEWRKKVEFVEVYDYSKGSRWAEVFHERKIDHVCRR